MKKNILIIGLGKSGIAAAKLSSSRGYNTTAIDENESENLIKIKEELEKQYKIQVLLGYSKNTLPDSEIIVVSPGISSLSKIGKIISNNQSEVISEIEFAYRFCKFPIIGITGTNGKTTVTELCTHILKNAGKNVLSGGNIGYPFSSLVLEHPNLDFAILELSSFQLTNISQFTPYTATILNIGSDHIDWHGTSDNYAAAKFNMFKNIQSSSGIVINYSLLNELKKFFPSFDSNLITFSSKSKNATFYTENNTFFHQSEEIFTFDDIPLSGNHNHENIMAATAICTKCGIQPEKIPELLKGFNTGPHRLELVAEKNGIKFINDSKSTNPDSLIAALDFIGGNKNVILIAGGLDKNMDFTSILKKKNAIKKIFLIGNCQNKLAKVWKTMLNYQNCNSLEQAVELACTYAEHGDVVLLSPACASMDMFENYIERGNLFKKIINRRLFS